MISGWKQELMTRAGELFARGNKAAACAAAAATRLRAAEQRPISETAVKARSRPGNQMTLSRVQPIASTHCASVIAICGAFWPSPPLIRRDIKNDAGIPFKPTSCRSSRGLQMI